MDDTARLSAALDGRAGSPTPAGVDAELLGLGEEIRSAWALVRLSAPNRQRLLERALAMAPPPPESLPDRWVRVLRQRGRASALVGGTAVVTLAAIGFTVAHQRRAHAPAAA